jgi:gliding motility-associated-like protein
LRRIFPIVFFTLFAVNSFCQNENAKWYFGNLAGLDFMTSPPSPLTNGAMTSSYICSSIADQAGNLQFYTDGTTAWNKSHTVMANGTAVSSLSAVQNNNQAVIIIPRPGNSTQYYIFSSEGGINYSLIDMTLAAGQGSVVSKNVNIYSNATTRKITATRHCNGIDIWVIAEYRTQNSAIFLSFLVTAAGIATPVVSQGYYTGNTVMLTGGIKMSANGKKLGVTTVTCFNCSVTPAYVVYDFNNLNGAVTNSLAILNGQPGFYDGLEFSPDGSKFYGMTGLASHGTGPTNDIYQWDLCAGSASAIAASQVNIGQGGYFRAMQLAPNGKIYCSTWNASSIAVINNPNASGTACGFSLTGQGLGTATSLGSIPNQMVNYRLSRPVPTPFTYSLSHNFGCYTASFSTIYVPGFTTFGCAPGYSLASLQWDFGDPSSGPLNTSTISGAPHTYSAMGIYTVQLILRYSCGGGTDTLRQTVNVNMPCFSIVSNSITCASLGSASIMVSGSPGPFSYTWLPTIQTGSAATGLIPGTHTILVFDAFTGSTHSATETFLPLLPLTGGLAHTPSFACYGAATASAAIVNLSGGSGNQTYQWTNGNSTLTVPSPTNLSGGTWTVTVTDALTFCKVTHVFMVLQPPAMTVLIAANTPSSCAGRNIFITSQASGGTPGYSFQWTNGPPSSSHTVAESTGGTHVYTLSATDANTCTVTRTVSVAFIANPALVISHASICPLETGTVSVSGATSYTWSNSSNNPSISDNPLSTTVYTVTGEASTCTSIATATILLKPVPVPLIASNSPRCEQTQLQLFSNGGAGYAWNGPLGYGSNAQNPVINSVQLTQAGVYNLTVTAANSCTAATSVTIVVNTIPTVAATGATVCTTQTLTLGAISVGGASFLWNGPAGFSSGLQNAFLNNPVTQASGNYMVRATSPQGCTNTAVASALVVPPPNLVTTLSSNSLCAQALNGSPNSIMMNATGGVTYTLNTPGHISYNSNPPWNLSSTPPYTPQIVVSTATLFGSNGVCTSSTTASFSVIPNPTVTVSNPTPAICAGETYTYTSNGANSYVWSASSPNYTSISNGGVAVANPSINALFSIIGSSLGCQSALVTSSMTVYPLPNVSVTPTQTNICIGSSAVLVAYGNATSYHWSPPNSLSATSGATVLVKPNSEMQYIVTGSANNCTRLAVANVSVLPLPLPTAAANSAAVCLNDKVIFKGTGGHFYSWKGPNNISFAGETATVTASSFIYSGVYTLTVIDKNGCANTAKTGFTINEFPSSGITGTKLSGCAPFCSDISLWTKSNSVNATFSVNGKYYASNTFKYCFQTPGTYTINGYFTDNQTGCQATESLVLRVPAVPQADFYWLPETPVESLEEVQFINSSSDENQVHWRWYFGNDKSYKPQTENASYFFRDAGTYAVALIVTNSAGCSDTIVKKVVIEGDFACYIPNAFTPNTDSKNEVFLPKVRGVHKYSLSIFNRWGEQVFYTQDHLEGWDGEFKGEQCKSDVYAYKIVLTTLYGEHREYSGQVLLYR